MKYYLLACLLAYHLAPLPTPSPTATDFLFSETERTDPFSWEQYGLQLESDFDSYDQACAQLIAQKEHFNQLLPWDSVTTDSLGRSFEDALVNQVFPFWYGTPWDFNGYTNRPGKGKIACGYFVSTTLKHVGLNLNRYRLAQQLPVHEAQSLDLGSQLQHVEGEIHAEALVKLQLKEGLYFIGFADSHVGFLLQRKSEIFLIHSNYLSDSGVGIERGIASEVFKSFAEFYLVPLSRSPEFLKAWAGGNEIVVQTGP